MRHRRRPRPGLEVVLRKASADTTRYTVQSVTKGAITIAAGETTKEVSPRDLLVVKRFGDPVYPVLRPATDPVVQNEARPFHTVLSGENFHALQLLLFSYEGQVDCIYIDPPYNTRDKDWKYNNNYVDPADAWHHSKWLSMMEKRLKLARRLLKPDGVLVVMIDEHELHHLGMLLERLFPEYLRYMVSIVINGRGSTGNRNFASIEEQALFVVPNLGYDLIGPREGFVPDFHPSTSDEPSTAERILAKISRTQPDLLDRLLSDGVVEDDEAEEWREAASIHLDGQEDFDEDDLEESDPEDVPEEDDPAAYWRGAVRTGQGTSFRTQRPNQFYPLFLDPKKPEEILVGKALLERDAAGNLIAPSWARVNGMVPIWPMDEDDDERVWCFEPGRMAAEIEKGNIKVGRFNPRRNTYTVNIRRVRRTRQRFRERTIWWEKSYDAGSNGTNILKRLLGSSGLFDFPKSLYAVRDVLATVVGSRPDALILDFFGGSGTALHATLLLNAVDDGRRRCIVVTNNEVADSIAVELNRAGKFRGDDDFEAMGVCHRSAIPRVLGCADRTAARRHEDRRKVQVGATASIRRWLPGKRCILRPRLRGSRPERDRRPVRRPAPEAVAVRWRSGRPVADEGSRKMDCRGRRAFRCAPRRGLLSGLPRRDVGAHRPHARLARHRLRRRLRTDAVPHVG